MPESVGLSVSFSGIFKNDIAYFPKARRIQNQMAHPI